MGNNEEEEVYNHIKYKEIFAKSFSKYERRKMGYWGMIAFFLIGVTFFTVYQPSFIHLPISNRRTSTLMDVGLSVVMDEEKGTLAQQLDGDMKQEIEVVDSETETTEIKLSNSKTKQDFEVEAGEVKPDIGVPYIELKQETEVANTTKDARGNEIPDTTMNSPEIKIPTTIVNSEENKIPTTTIVNLQGREVPNIAERNTEGKLPGTTNSQEIKIPTSTVNSQEIKIPPNLLNPQETEIPNNQPKNPEVKVPYTTNSQEFKIPATKVNSQETMVSDNIEVNQEIRVPNATITPQETKVSEAEIRQKIISPVCKLERKSDSCDIKESRIHGKSSTILYNSHENGYFTTNESWRIKPYARKEDKSAMSSVTEFTVKPFTENNTQTLQCTHNHNIPAVVFSVSGFSSNHFHDFADTLVPLFLTSHQFNQEVQFLITNIYRPSWIKKYEPILKQLSKYPIIDIDKEDNVHCYPRVLLGLIHHKEFGIDPLKPPKGYSMTDFSKFLRTSFSLQKSTAIKLRDANKHNKKKPRLLLISRKRSRKFVNEGEIVKMAESLGYEVVVEEPGTTKTYPKSVEIVNSCDVMVGVHGAGLTNLVYLPTNAVLIQIIPFGPGMDWLANYFSEPAKELKLKYLGHKIRLEESSLIEQYSLDDQVLKNPLSVSKQGWELFRSVYLNKQDVKLDVVRFRATLVKALKLLH